jgi:outer membrane protein OmpA-like peptidoglycan-associated protein
LRIFRWIAAALVAMVGTAHAQEAGYQLDRYEPTPAGDPFLAVESPWYSTAPSFAAALVFDYAHNLLAAEHREPDGTVVSDPSPIAHHEAAHLALAGSIANRIGLSLNIPIVLGESGTAFAGVAPSGTTAGDPRAGVRVRLFGDESLSLSGAGYLWIPVGVDEHLAGDQRVRGMARVTLGGQRDVLRWSSNLSFLARERAVLTTMLPAEGNSVGSEVQLAGGIAYTADRFAVGPEATLAIPVVDLPSSQSAATLEVLATGRYAITDELTLGAGVGGGVAGSGLPDARVLFSLSYAPRRIPRLTSSFERVVVIPDEDGHIGGVEVNDGKTTTLLDKPYASTEVTKRDGRAHAVQSSPQAVAQSTAALEKALPPSDRDRDGIVDASDGCPERAGVENADPVRNGCPPAAEKIVVLPDADGHVGGVEVDDGKTKTLLDKPYASAEVSADGVAQAVTAAPPRAVERTVASVAQSLPPPDADEDGIVDQLDACADRAGLPSPNPIRNGCPAAAERVVVLPDPDGHIGGVEVDDGKTKTLINTAYAGVDVSADGVAHAVDPTRPRSVDRAIEKLASTLPAADGDKDGIRDEDDACPERAGAFAVDPIRNGCPVATEKVVVLPDADGHVGGVEINDGTHTVVLDKAYASAEVTGTKVQAIASAPIGVMTRATSQIAKTLPAPDRDDDSIVDNDDACPTRPGKPSSQANRNGCPTSVEQVVVLPDENGHVGAVEVDDGQSKIVLDQAYASTEVGTDGIARSLPAEATEVSAKYGAAMAAQSPGARIILYFTAKAEPVRDLTGPLDNLVAELKARTDSYTLDVVGHTDQTGSERANIRIGQQRAQLIADRLIAAGVPQERIHVKSMGSKEPAVKRKSRKIVELRNRRVEIWVR